MIVMECKYRNKYKHKYSIETALEQGLMGEHSQDSCTGTGIKTRVRQEGIAMGL